MKRLVLVSVAFLLVSVVSSSVQAQPASDWTGFYAGLNVGYGWGDHAMTLSGDPLSESVIAAGVLPRSVADDPDGVSGGAQVGYNHQIRWLVLGAETDFQGTDISARESVSTTVAGFFPFTTTGEQELTFLGTLRGRLGVAPWKGVLFYGTGGFAYGDVRVKGSVISQGCPGVCASESQSELQTGWTVGGGIEYGFAARWSVKAEYLHYDLGRVSLDVRDGRFPALVQTFRADIEGSVARIGVNFRF